MLDPCLPPGMMWTVDGGGQSLEGTGDYDLCRRSLEPLLRQSAPCTVEPCSMDGVHQPEVNFSSSQFYGFSEFWYTMEDIFDVGGPYDHDTFDALAHVCHPGTHLHPCPALTVVAMLLFNVIYWHWLRHYCWVGELKISLCGAAFLLSTAGVCAMFLEEMC